MKIAIIADPIDNQKGGVHVYTKEVVNGLIAAHSHHTFMLVRERKDLSLLNVKQIVIPNIRIGLGLAALRLFIIVPLVLWWNKVDAVFEPAHFGPFNLPRRIRRITMIHDLTPFLFPHYHRFHSQILQKIFLPGILRRANVILANSVHTAKDILRFFPDTRSKVVPILLGCDPIFKPMPASQFLEEAGIHKPYWLAVGTIEPRKNLVRLLDAFAQWRKINDNNGQLVIVGQKGWRSEAFYEALEKHPYTSSIVLTGYVSDESLAVLYTHAVGLIYPSEYEGFGLPVLEALNCGCPVICSGVSSLPEVGGSAVLYVDPLDISNIVTQMTTLFSLSEEERNHKISASLAQAAKFRWSNHVQTLLKILDQLELRKSLDEWTMATNTTTHFGIKKDISLSSKKLNAS